MYLLAVAVHYSIGYNLKTTGQSLMQLHTRIT